MKAMLVFRSGTTKEIDVRDPPPPYYKVPVRETRSDLAPWAEVMSVNPLRVSTVRLLLFELVHITEGGWARYEEKTR